MIRRWSRRGLLETTALVVGAASAKIWQANASPLTSATPASACTTHTAGSWCFSTPPTSASAVADRSTDSRDAASPSTLAGDAPEEFPDFTTFWVTEPEDGAPHVDIVALLDGPSITGAYLFRAQPELPATLTVRTTLFLRKSVETLDLAPLTSMFVHGSNGPVGHYEHRPSGDAVAELRATLRSGGRQIVETWLHGT
jgi:hypothetical protein